MTGGETGEATVLVVDDEPDVAALYGQWISSEHEVLTAHGGEEAMDLVDDDVDVVLLDRRMPGQSGDELLAAIRERNYDVRVALVTAIDPEFDLADTPCDDYLVKPVTEEELLDTVDLLLTVATYDEKRRLLTSKRIRRNVLEVERSRRELDASEEFQRLEAEIEELEREVDEMDEDLGDRVLRRRS